jgi:hypothetical protein
MIAQKEGMMPGTYRPETTIAADESRRADLSTRIAGGVAAMAAAFVMRKLITAVWTKATGKQPPTHPEDPQVALGEALGWAILTGVGVEAARLLATRAAAKRAHHEPQA